MGPSPERHRVMRTQVPKTVALGELISATFDEAAQYSADPHEVTHLAVQAVEDMLSHATRRIDRRSREHN
jgi:hypothetical protein